jgi:hypothetical protein
MHWSTDERDGARGDGARGDRDEHNPIRLSRRQGDRCVEPHVGGGAIISRISFEGLAAWSGYGRKPAAQLMCASTSAISRPYEAPPEIFSRSIGSEIFDIESIIGSSDAHVHHGTQRKFTASRNGQHLVAGSRASHR